MTAATDLSLPDGWTETRFERGTFGPDDRPGFAAALADDPTTVEVLPVRYRRRGGRERVRGLARDVELVRRDPTAAGDAGPLTAFATRVAYRPVEAEREAVVCVARDAGDALAVGAWLARAAADGRALRRALAAHAGRSVGRDVVVADDEALDARLSAAPERCALTGRPTRSHPFDLPYRYFPLLSGTLTSARGVPRFPGTVAALAGVVSHGAWEDRGLHAVDLDAPVERAGPGDYRLDADVAALAADLDATALSLRRLGDEREA